MAATFQFGKSPLQVRTVDVLKDIPCSCGNDAKAVPPGAYAAFPNLSDNGGGQMIVSDWTFRGDQGEFKLSATEVEDAEQDHRLFKERLCGEPSVIVGGRPYLLLKISAKPTDPKLTLVTARSSGRPWPPSDFERHVEQSRLIQDAFDCLRKDGLDIKSAAMKVAEGLEIDGILVDQEPNAGPPIC